MIRFSTELRSEVAGNKLAGYASVFGQGAQLPGHVEMIARSAFDAVLADPATDVRALFNHDPAQPLARQSAGTLRLSTDSQGLEFELDLPATTLGNDVRAMVESGLITGASFGFVPGTDSWSTRGATRVRTHTSVKRLVDISPVTFPAYDGASVALRSIDFDRVTRRRSQLVRARARVALGEV